MFARDWRAVVAFVAAFVALCALTACLHTLWSGGRAALFSGLAVFAAAVAVFVLTCGRSRAGQGAP